MKLTRVDSPNSIKQVTTNETAAKAKAVAAFNQNAHPPQAIETPQQTPVNTPIPVDANNISVEEITAVSTQNQAQNRSDVAATTTEELPKEVTPPQEEAKPDPSQQYQLLARKERQLRAKAQQQSDQIKAEREALKAHTASLEARIKELESSTISRQKLKERAFETLIEEGVSYDDITQQAIDSQQKNPRYEAYISRLEAKIEALETKTANNEKAQQDATTNQYNSALKQIEKDVSTLVRQNPNEYEMIAKTRSIRDVRDLIESTYKQGLLKTNAQHNQDWEYAPGEIMSTEEAATIVENHLAEEAWKLANTNKIKSRAGKQQATTPQPQKTQTQTKQPQPMKTLTNATSSSRTLSTRERAILAMEGKLNN